MHFVVANTKEEAKDYAWENKIGEYRAITLRSDGPTRGRMVSKDDQFVVLPLDGTTRQRERMRDALAPCGPPSWVLDQIRGVAVGQVWYHGSYRAPEYQILSLWGNFVWAYLHGFHEPRVETYTRDFFYQQKMTLKYTASLRGASE